MCHAIWNDSLNSNYFLKCIFWKTFRSKFCPTQSFWFKMSLESTWTPPSAVILSGLEKVKRHLLAQSGSWLIASGCKRGKWLPAKIESRVWAQKSQSSHLSNRLNKMKQHQQKFWAEVCLTFFVNKGKSLKGTVIRSCVMWALLRTGD